LTFAVVQALKDGYEGMFVADAVGGRSQSAHRTAIERMAHAGAVPNTALAVVTELFRDWALPLADKAREAIYWYFGEVTKLKVDVGVSEVEKQAIRQGVHRHRDGRQRGSRGCFGIRSRRCVRGRV
jgi:hypothetical protein